MPTPAVSNVENNHCLTFNGEQNPVAMGPVPIQKLAHLKGKIGILRRKWTTGWKLGQRAHSGSQIAKLSQTCSTGILGDEPIENSV